MKTEGDGKNPDSAANGRFQWMPLSWRSNVRLYAKDYHDPAYHKFSDASNTSKQEVEALRSKNDDFKNYITYRFTMANKQALQAGLGRGCTAGELYLAHQQGTSGALGLLRNPEDNAISAMQRLYKCGRTLPAGITTLKEVKAAGIDPKSMSMAEKVILLNGGTTEMTSAQFAGKWMSRFDNSRPMGNGMLMAQAHRPPAPGASAYAPG
jgi:hypothetical protein